MYMCLYSTYIYIACTCAHVYNHYYVQVNEKSFDLKEGI